MKRTLFFLALYTFTYSGLFAQAEIDSVLASITRNNKQLKVKQQYNAAAGQGYLTGITLSDPFVEYDYLGGSPASNGDVQEFKVTQAFDFPTAYGRKRKLAELQTELLQTEYTSQRQDILAEARRMYLDIVWYNRQLQWLLQRKTETTSHLQAFQKRLDRGEGNILEVNKARIQLIAVERKYNALQTELNVTKMQLTELNGGIPLETSGWNYPVVPAVPEFASLEKEYELNDPHRMLLEQEKLLAQQQLQVSKALWFPRMELGYRYEDTPGQSFSGIHTGISIPLWENRNTVKREEQFQLVAGLQLESHLNEHYYELNRKYEQFIQLREVVASYEEVFGNNEIMRLLSKAFSAGQLSASEYYQEVVFYDDAYEAYLKAERDLHVVLTELYKYRL
jgi:cobalt-zinc-cadmium efflux system outer membrane protein